MSKSLDIMRIAEALAAFEPNPATLITKLNTMAAGGGGASLTFIERVATAGQTTFAELTYTVGKIRVYRNGLLLPSGAYTATTGTTVVLANPCYLNDDVIFMKH